jgi:hypothetical protein
MSLSAELFYRFDALLGGAAQPERQIVSRGFLAKILLVDDLLQHANSLSDRASQLNLRRPRPPRPSGAGGP